MNLTCRDLDKTHIPQFFALCRELEDQKAGVSFVRYKTQEQLEQLLDDELIHLFGAFDGDKLVGVFQARQGEGNKTHSCHIGGAVTSELRGKKVSSRMMEYALERLKHRGIWMIRAYVYSNNPASVASLLAAGFTWAGTVYKHQWDEEQGRWLDDLIFHKEI
jgi:RimJ/RimL family protein N-acetyltransferase